MVLLHVSINNSSGMKSLVLYCKSIPKDALCNTMDGKAPQYNNTVEFHINLWKAKNGVVKIMPNLIFDFGIKFESTITELCIFLPFRISKELGVEDLGKCLSTNRDLLNAVFNEDMICQSASNHCFSRITNNTNCSEQESFYIYHLGEDNYKVEDYTEDSKVKGTYLTINISGNPSNEEKTPTEKYYVRFRVYVENISEIVRTEILSNDLLQAAFSRMDLFDIRLNEKREIPSKVEEKMKKQQFKLCTFNKLHFFYIVDTHESIDNGIDIRKDSRLLENEQWSEYEPQSNIADVNYIAHHWKKTEDDKPISHFSLFFSTIYPRLSVVRLAAYFSIVIILGWTGSMLSFSFSCLFDISVDLLWVKWIKPIIILLIIAALSIYIIKPIGGIKL